MESTAQAVENTNPNPEVVMTEPVVPVAEPTVHVVVEPETPVVVPVVAMADHAAVVAEPEPAVPVAAAAESEEEGESKKRPAEDAPEDAPAAKKRRITQATIDKHLRKKGKLLDNQIFSWKKWCANESKFAEEGDVTFSGCHLKVEIKNAAGEVVLKPKQSCRFIEWFHSKSLIVFHPTSSVSDAIICQLQVAPLPSFY